MKLSLCIIVKNEERSLPKLFESIVPYVDEVVVTDTGSTDNTKAVCEKYVGDKLKWTEFTWCDDFAAARNENFSHATGDWIVWADADDSIVGANKFEIIIEEAEKNNVNAVMFPYHYLRDEYGNTKVLQYRERLIKRGSPYHWIGRLHETMLPETQQALALRLEDIIWVHNTTPEKIEASKERNLSILEAAMEDEVKRDAVDPRTLFNLGNAYFSCQRYDMASLCYLKYVPLSGWSEERYLARLRMSHAFLNQGKFDESTEAALSCLLEHPEFPDAYIALGRSYYEKKDFERALFWFKEARKKELPISLPAYNPTEYLADLPWLTGHCLIQLYRFEEAKPYIKQFLSYYPEHADAKEILKGIDEAIEDRDIVKAIVKVGKMFKTDDFWKTVPMKYMEIPEVLIEKNQTIRKPKSTGKDIAIYCGNCVVPWDPVSALTNGIGGSEEAVIHVARRLAVMGWNVTVFGRPLIPHKYSDVDYRHYTDFNPRDSWDIFISWRMPSVLDAQINAKKKYIWLHDCTPESAFSPTILNNTDKIFVLSKAHRDLYPRIPEEKFFYTGNGVDVSDFLSDVKKNEFYCINTSAPDRGLETLLTLWPKIIEQVPQAELHWFYGWEVFDELHKDNPEKQAYKKRIFELLDQPNVYNHGRVDHMEIAKKYQEAALWVYPTEFYETFCITAIKSQLAGAVPVTTTVGALNETVQFGTKIDCQDIYTNKQAQDEFVSTVVGYLNGSIEKPNCDTMKQWVEQTHSWDIVATNWNNLFLS